MLKKLTLTHLGPVETIDLDFSERFNVITGDNGLGKSFVLDVAWWALTRQWAGLPAWPRPAAVDKASIHARITGEKGGISKLDSTFVQGSGWSPKGGRPANPGLVVYARVDGGFAVWDPARNDWRSAPSMGISDPDRPAAYVFQPHEVWEGLERRNPPTDEAASRLKSSVLCRGLIAHWVDWQRRESDEHRQLCHVLEELSPPDGKLEPGEPADAYAVTGVEDDRELPTIRMPHGEVVPAHFVSAGVRRIMALSYLLVWAWQSHLKACERTGRRPTRRIVVLVDEIEAHLHPRWQRTILRSLRRVMEKLESQPEVQLLAATHSPLVLASLEPLFEAGKDRLWAFNLRGRDVDIHRVDFYPHGNVNDWLVETFGLGLAASEEAERAVELVLDVFRADAPGEAQIERADRALRAARLAPGTALGARWALFKAERGAST